MGAMMKSDIVLPISMVPTGVGDMGRSGGQELDVNTWREIAYKHRLYILVPTIPPTLIIQQLTCNEKHGEDLPFVGYGHNITISTQLYSYT